MRRCRRCRYDPGDHAVLGLRSPMPHALTFMDQRLYLMCLWPGLPRLWLRGDPAGIPAALAFTLVVNGLLVLRFVYPEWLGLTVKLIGWGLIFFWIYDVLRNARELPHLVRPRAAAGQADSFGDAQKAFLAGKWLEAEKLLRQMLQVEPRDPPSLLLLTAVYRLTDRLTLAQHTLDALAQLEAGDAWFLERRAEQARVTRARQPASDT